MAAGALLSSSSLLSGECQAKDFDVNKRMRGIRAQTFRGIGEVIPREARGASKLLVVIDQGHFSPGHPEWMLRSTEQCQSEILTAVEDLRRNTHTSLKELLMEGVVERQEAEYLSGVERQLQEYMAAVPENNVAGEFLQLSPNHTPFQKRIRSAYFLNARIPLVFEGERDGMEQKKTVVTSSLAHIGAGPILGYRGEIAMHGAEDGPTLKKAQSIDSDVDPDLYDLWANKKREENVLTVASKRKDPISYVIFGARHKWEERIDQWNREHDPKFSLLRLRPKEMVKVMKYLSELPQE